MEYVYNGTLVKKTGRKAQKMLPQTRGNRRPTQQSTAILYEVTPAEGDLDWKEWVKQEDLYVVIQEDTFSNSPIEPDEDLDDAEDGDSGFIQPPELKD